jgi:hypothetical protein
VVWGKVVPKEREVERWRGVCEWEGFVCAREAIGASSMLRLIRRVVAFARMLPTLDLTWEYKAARRKRNWSWLCCACSTPQAAQKPDEPAKTQCVQAHSEGGQRC